MVKSAAYPTLGRVPGKQNWVDYAGGLPKYIERIAKHLHYERGYSISHAIASAVNTVKRWAHMGRVAKYGDPHNMHVTPKTAALAAKAVAEWEAKKKSGKARMIARALNLSDSAFFGVLELSDVSTEWAYDLAVEMGYAETGADRPGSATLPTSKIDLSGSLVNIDQLAQRAERISDPTQRAEAQKRILDFAVPASKLTADKRRKYAAKGQAMPDGSFPVFDETSLRSAIRLARTPQQRLHVIRRARSLGLARLIPDSWNTDLASVLGDALDLASTIAPRNARGRVSDGRRSYRGQGKWKHGFIPITSAAAEAKAKGSPIALKRLARLFGKPGKDQSQASAAVRPGTAKNRRPRKASDASPVTIKNKTGSTENAKGLSSLSRSQFDDAVQTKRPGARSRKEASKVGRENPRATQNWDDIPDQYKTVRNGKRYVVANYGGQQIITEWVGGTREVDATPLAQRKVMRTITTADAQKLSTGQIRALLKNPQTPASVRKQLNKALRTKVQEAASRG